MQALFTILLLLSTTAFAASSTPKSKYCRPSMACWPTEKDWTDFKTTLTGTLEEPKSPLAECEKDAASDACATAKKNLRNPFHLEDQSGATQSSGWLGAWSAARSAYAVVAENANDVSAALAFAKKHNLRLVIKSTGHDYLGRSNAPDSLLVWMHKMRDVKATSDFVPKGCGPEVKGKYAANIGGGARWLEAYQEVTVKNGRYVQGGGCTSVGAAGGFLQGGGFGSWSKKYGVAAASLLEAEIIVADGRVLTANSCQNQDLFWALRGGGGGTFGVVTRVTLQTHPLPNYFGWVNGSIKAKDDKAFKSLVERFVRFYGSSLSNEHWGEQVKVRGDNTLELSLAFEGMSQADAEKVWEPFTTWVNGNSDLSAKMRVSAIHGSKMWDFDFIMKNFPGAIKVDERTGEPRGFYWWAGDGDQVSVFWYSYQSRWIPKDLFVGRDVNRFSNALFKASRHWTVGLHFNKGQAGASEDARKRGKEISMNPGVFDAAALLIAGAGGDGFTGVKGSEPNKTEGEKMKTKVNAAMKVIRKITPGAGSYVNETDYFEPNWQAAFWGTNYPKLLAIKKKYDPDGLFTCHHCVGSEEK